MAMPYSCAHKTGSRLGLCGTDLHPSLHLRGATLITTHTEGAAQKLLGCVPVDLRLGPELEAPVGLLHQVLEAPFLGSAPLLVGGRSLP